MCIEDVLSCGNCLPCGVPVPAVPKLCRIIPWTCNAGPCIEQLHGDGIKACSFRIAAERIVDPDIEVLHRKRLWPAICTSCTKQSGVFVPYLCCVQSHDKFDDGF